MRTHERALSAMVVGTARPWAGGWTKSIARGPVARQGPQLGAQAFERLDGRLEAAGPHRAPPVERDERVDVDLLRLDPCRAVPCRAVPCGR
jgi:hypothetical protein